MTASTRSLMRLTRPATACLPMIAIVLNLMSFAAHASDDEGEYVGYLRVGAGVSQYGGPQNCYYLGNGNGHGYRLGNECDSYTEFGYSKTMAKSDDGVRFVGHIMVNHFSPNSAYSGNLQITQIFVDVKDLSWLNGGTAWMGERYYERPDIHSMDLQYINLNGTGGGFDSINTALGGKFSYALFKDNDTNNFVGTAFTSSESAIRNNLLYRELPVNPGGKLDLIFGLITPSSPSHRYGGFNAHLFHNQEILGGNNTFGIQYGVGPGTGRGAPAAFDPTKPYLAFGSAGVGPDAVGSNRMGQSGSTLLGGGDTRLRVFDALLIQPTRDFSMSFDLMFQADKSPVYGKGTSNWESFGVRPEYAFTQHFKLQGEVGVDHVTYPGAASESLMKYTIAPTLTLGPGYYDRPELRLFVTHANWNSAAGNTVNANNAGGTSIGTVKSSTSIGIQLEAFWGKNWF